MHVTRAVPLGLAGLGWWGQRLLQESIDSDCGIRIVAAADPDTATRSQVDPHILRLHESYEALIADPGIEGVLLATPVGCHLDQVRAAAARGLHVYVEKPLALNTSDAQAAALACEEAGVTLAVGTDKRFLPSVQAAERAVLEGRLGEVLRVEGNYSNNFLARGLSGVWRSDPRQAPAAGLTGPALHVLDAISRWAGPVDSARCTVAEQSSGADGVTVDLKFRSGAAGTASAVRGTPEYFRLAAFGTEGWVEVSGFGTVRGVTGDQSWLEVDRDEIQPAIVLARFGEAVSGGRAFPVTIDQVLDSTALLEAAITSFGTGGGWVPVRPPVETQ